MRRDLRTAKHRDAGRPRGVGAGGEHCQLASAFVIYRRLRMATQRVHRACGGSCDTGGDTAACAGSMVGGGISSGFDEHPITRPVTASKVAKLDIQR